MSKPEHQWFQRLLFRCLVVQRQIKSGHQSHAVTHNRRTELPIKSFKASKENIGLKIRVLDQRKSSKIFVSSLVNIFFKWCFIKKM
jgi:hypothetical protein